MGIRNRLRGPKSGFVRLLQDRGAIVFVVAFAIVGGSILLLATHAASPYASINASQGTLAGGAQIIADSNASNGNAVKFGLTSGGGTGNCPGLANGTAAFCDTFDAPAGTGNRSGDLNGVVWGVSRMLAGWNFGQQQYDRDAPIFAPAPPHAPNCNTSTVNVVSPNDVVICNGQLQETTNDNAWTGTVNGVTSFDQGTVTSLAAYPKQPFDFAGRTGIVSFDLSADSFGNHSAWPEFWMSDKPVPDPFTHFSSDQTVPQDGFGIRFAAYCPANSGGCGARNTCSTNEPQNVPVMTVDSAVTINNYVSNDSFTDVAPGPISVQSVDCVKASSGAGDMNRFQIHVSQNEIDVYGSDAGDVAHLRLITRITNLNLNPSFHRGLIWLEDAHYNADKQTNQAYPNSQREHTFSWDNVGFDGPVVARDLAFDVLDSKTATGCDGSGTGGCINLGWNVPVASSANDATTPLTLTTVGGMTSQNIAAASGPILTFNYYSDHPVSIYYKINSGAWQTGAYPFPPCFTQNGVEGCGPRTIHFPVNASDLHAGTNTIQLKSSGQTGIANVDIILPAAGG